MHLLKTFARALVHCPRLLIMDEATTALDLQSEATICETLQQLRGRQTILAISHQPALLEAADRAYRMQDGMHCLRRILRASRRSTADHGQHQDLRPARHQCRE